MRFTLTVGDFSLDGHGRTMDFLAEADGTIEQIREAHKSIKKKTGIDLSRICNDSEDDVVPASVVRKLSKLGIDLKTDDGKGSATITAEDMAAIWAGLLDRADPSLHIRLIPTEDYPSLLCSGMGFSPIGYGLL